MWIQWLGTVLVLAVAGHAGLRLVVASRSSAHTRRGSDATQVLMGSGMAAMLAPLGDPIPGAGWEALFGVVVGWCIVATLRERVPSQRLMWVRHAVMGIAILYMFGATAMPMPMSGVEPTAGWPGGGLPMTALTWILVAYFGCCATWAALTAVGVELRGAAVAATPAGNARLPAVWMLAPRATSLCEGVMASSMACMLLAMR
jgi:uncharacterized protein DUF5134